jgi:hypothetical protein
VRPLNGIPFEEAVLQCTTSNELSDMVSDYEMSSMELAIYENTLNLLIDYEALVHYEDEAKQKAEDFVVRIYGRDHPDFARLVVENKKVEMDAEWSLRQAIDAAIKSDRRRIEQDYDRHRALQQSIKDLGDRIEQSSAYAQGRKLVGRHPFLTGLLGPLIALKILGN